MLSVVKITQKWKSIGLLIGCLAVVGLLLSPVIAHAQMQTVDCAKAGGDGNCSIDSIVQQAIYFASFIMGLSGSLFLVIFIYGGALYLASFGTAKYAQKGKDAMVKSTIGIVLVLGAWTIVSYVASSIGYQGSGGAGTTASGTDEACAKQHAGHSCMMVTPAQEKSEYVCYKNLCHSNKDTQFKCCIQAPTNK